MENENYGAKMLVGLIFILIYTLSPLDLMPGVLLDDIAAAGITMVCEAVIAFKWIFNSWRNHRNIGSC